MNTFLVPSYNMEKLYKLTKKMSKKTPVRLEVDENNPVFVKPIGAPPEYPYKIKCYNVSVEGKFQVKDFEFVATLEHKETGNIIRTLSEKELPLKFRTCGPKCEHCGKIRNRKDTYVFYNFITQEYKQVGKKCLRDYLGTDLEELTAYLAYIKSFQELNEIPEINSFEFGALEKSSRFINVEAFKTFAYDEIKSKGYCGQGKTVRAIFKRMDEEKLSNDKYKEPLQKITEWINSQEILSWGTYMYNAKVAWNSNDIEYRDTALIASLINVYFKNEQEIIRQNKLRDSTHHVGKVGDKIEIEIASLKVLYIKDNSWKSYYAQSTIVYRIIDENGNIFKYSSSKNLENVKRIKATIKGHSEYKGEKQTIITRAKVLETKAIENEPEKQDVLSYSSNDETVRSCDKAIDDFLKLCDEA